MASPGKTYSDGTTPPVTYTYDTAGRLATAANGTDTLTWSYDLAGQLLSEQSTKNSSTVAYTYDDGGNRLSVSLDGTLFVSDAYDDASRLTTITRGSNVFGFGYDNANRRASMTYPNGVNTSYSYDNLNRLLNLSATKASTTITNFTYTYDAGGNRTSKVLPDYTEAYGYDPLQRLTQVQRTGSLTGLNTYSYDALGNRLTNQQDSAVTTSTYNEKNQLTGSTGGGTMLWRGTLDEPGSVQFTSALVNGKPARMLPGNVFEANLPMQSGSNTVSLTARDTSGNVATKNYSVDVSGNGGSYTYDANGNLATKTEGSDSWVYEWNAENQLTRVLKNSAEQANFRYDPSGRRVEKTIGGVTSYTYAGDAIVRLATGAGAVTYIHGPGMDEPLASEDGAGVLSLLSADGLGSVVAMTASAGATVSVQRYGSWGTTETGTPSPFGFTGREADETGLLYYRARYYDSNVGRFISPDPVGFAEGVNFYQYVRNRVTVKRDPSGLQQVGGPLTDPNEPGVGGAIGCLNGKLVVFIKVFDFDELNCGIAGCIIEHEQQHIKSCPGTPCKDMPDFATPWFGSDKARQADEQRAYDAERKCLLRAPGGKSCQQVIDCRLKFIACLVAHGFSGAACNNVCN